MSSALILLVAGVLATHPAGNPNARMLTVAESVGQGQQSVYPERVPLFWTPDSQLTKDSDIQQMSRFITILAPREQRVVSLIYGIEGERHTMAEVASLMGLKRERVRQVRDQALRKLGKAAKANA